MYQQVVNFKDAKCADDFRLQMISIPHSRQYTSMNENNNKADMFAVSSHCRNVLPNREMPKALFNINCIVEPFKLNENYTVVFWSRQYFVMAVELWYLLET